MSAVFAGGHVCRYKLDDERLGRAVAMSDDAFANGLQSRATAKSICLDGRAFAVFGAAGGGAFRAEDGDAKVPDFVVDPAKGGFGEFVRRGKSLFELRDANMSRFAH
jgi:hypothetical protein